MNNSDLLRHPDRFVTRHLGPRDADIAEMLETMGLSSLDQLVEQTVPASIRGERPLDLPAAVSESEVLAELRELAEQNRVFRSYLGLGYHGTVTPPAILRNILENPGWYTQYTPYQPEISQGRLEALLNFQTLIIDLTGMEVANASMLDEATAAAEAMTLAKRVLDRKSDGKSFFVSERCHPQTIELVKTRALPLHIPVIVGDHAALDPAKTPVFGVLVQYPASDGEILDYGPFIAAAHAAGALAVVAADPLALTVLRPPGEFGADVVVGSAQRFGVPMGYGGPHAGYMATKDAYKRHLPGRLIGVSKDSSGKPAMRLSLQVREQHIRRDKATSNICTAQVLLAVIASMYAVYHGPDGLKAIARRVRLQAGILARALEGLGATVRSQPASSTPCASRRRPAGPSGRCSTPPWRWGSTCAPSTTATSGSRSTRPSPSRTSTTSRRRSARSRPRSPRTPVHSPAASTSSSKRRTPAPPTSWRTRSSTATARRPSCCATSSGSSRATCR